MPAANTISRICQDRGAAHPGVTEDPASMGSAIQAGDSAISRCRNRELDTAGPDTAEEGARVLAGLRSGDGPRSGRARPSSIKRDCGRRTREQEKVPGNVHAKSRLIPETLRTLRPETRARPQPARTGAQAIPCKVQACNQRAISHGNQRPLRSLRASQVAWSARLSRKICPIPKLIVRVRYVPRLRSQITRTSAYEGRSADCARSG